MSPNHGLQLFTDCSSMSPFHSVQSFRSRLLQGGLSTELEVLLASVVCCGLLSTQFHRSFMQSVPVQDSHRFTASSQASTCSSVEFSTSAPTGTSMGCRGISVSSPEVLSPPPSPLTLMFAELLFSYILSSLCDSVALLLPEACHTNPTHLEKSAAADLTVLLVVTAQ